MQAESGPRGQGHQLPALLASILACVLGVAAHAPSVGSSFVWDDVSLIEAPLVQELHPVQDYFSASFWQPSDMSPDKRMYFRPLSTLSLAVDHAVHGERASGYHATNLVLHGACVLFVFLLARRLGATPNAALLGALVLGWFPRATESVAWISGRTDLLATLPALGALLVTVSRLPARRWIAAVLVALALASKEVALAAACGIGLYELGREVTWRKRALGILPVVCAVAAFVLLRVRAIGLLSGQSGLPLAQRALGGLEAVARYAWMLVDGWQPRLQIGSPLQLSVGLVLVGAVLFASALGFGIACAIGKIRLRADTSLLLVTAAGAIGLVLHIVPVHLNVVAADRFLYMPVACLGVLLAVAITAHSGRAFALVSVLVLSYLPVTIQRAAMWSDEIRFWTTAAREQSGEFNAMSRVGLGDLFATHGLYEKALRSFRAARPGDSRNYILARHNAAGVLAVQGHLDEACKLTERTLQMFELPSLYTKLATLRAALGQESEAEAALAAYARQASDTAKVAEARHEVLLAAQLGAELRQTGGLLALESDALGQDVEARLERVRTLLRLQINDVAFKEVAPLLQDGRVGADRARHLLLLALEHAGPRELRLIYERTKAMTPEFPAALDTVVAERLASTGRLELESRGLP